MTIEQQPIDITDLPELGRLADEVRASRRPRLLRRGAEEIAMLVPVVPFVAGVITPMPPNPELDALLAGLPKDDPVVRTAGALHTDQPFLDHEEEEAALALAIGLEGIADRER